VSDVSDVSEAKAPRPQHATDARDRAPGSAELRDLVCEVAEDALLRGLVEIDPVIPIDYRRVICLSDGSRVDVRLTRLLPCACGRVHGRDGSASCAAESAQSAGSQP
jgi:hypothetical protein